MSYNPKWLENSTDTQMGGFNGANGSNELVPTQYAVREYIDQINSAANEPTGLPARSDNTIAMGVDGTDVFSIQPTGDYFDYFLRGQRYRVESKQTVTISDVEGIHYVYFDATGNLTETTTFNVNLIYSLGYVAVIYWDATNKKHIYMGDERHGISMSGDTHLNLHLSQGTIYVDGLGIGDITTDSTSATASDAQLSVTSGTIYDEDLIHVISQADAPANIPMFYLDGSGNWRREDADDYPVVNTGTGRVAWNNTSSGLSEATDGYFVLTHIFATNDPDQEIVGIVGQAQHASISAARDAAESEINTIVAADLPFEEFVAIGTVIFETDDTFGNAVKAVIRSTNSGGDYQDWRFSKITPVIGSGSDHGTLSGLADDDHLQYLRTDGARTCTGSQEFAAGVDVSGGTFALATGTTVNDISTDTTLSGDSNDSLVTEAAIKSYVDSGDSTVDSAAQGYASSAQSAAESYADGIVATNAADSTAYTDAAIAALDLSEITAGDSSVSVADTGTGTVTITVDGGTVGTWNASGLQLGTANARINEFSTDGTLADDSDTAVPTEKAVKAYVDAAIGGAVSHNSTTGLQGGDSTADEFYHLTANEESNIFATSATVFGIGDSAGTSVVIDQTSDTISAGVDQVDVFSMTADTQRLGIAGTSAVAIDSTSVAISVGTFDVTVLDGSMTVEGIATFDSDGLTLASGASINEFSTDGTLAGNSDDAVPTEQAVKTYVDTEIGALSQNRIEQSTDSYVQVIDDGTNSGYVEIVCDGVQVAYWDADAATQRLGKATSAGKIEIADAFVKTSIGSIEVLDLEENVQRLGVDGDTYISMNQSGDTLDVYVGGTLMIDAGASSITVGHASDSRLVLDQSGDTADLYAGNINGLSLGTDTQRLGVSGDTYITMGQTSGDIDMYSNGTLIVDMGQTSQVIGAAGDTRLTLDQSADTFSITAGASTVVSGGLTSLTLGVCWRYNNCSRSNC
jgi:hypothetical protein